MAPWGGLPITVLVLGTCIYSTMVALGGSTTTHGFSFSTFPLPSTKDMVPQTFGAQCFCSQLRLGQRHWLLPSRTFGLPCYAPMQLIPWRGEEINNFRKCSRDEASDLYLYSSRELILVQSVPRHRIDCLSSIELNSCFDASRILFSFQFNNNHSPSLPVLAAAAV